eukprot:XP_011677263.1 PREDICTED: noelin [Strongylocentrotus purpuratus]
MATKPIVAMLMLFLLCYTSEVSAQCIEYSVLGSGESMYDSCICDIQVGPVPGCSNPPSPAELAQIEYIQAQVTNISVRIDEVKVNVETNTVEIEKTQANLDAITYKLERIENGDLKVNRPEFELIMEEIDKLELVLKLLEVERTNNLDAVAQLETELTAVQTLLYDLKKTQNVEILLEQIEALEEDLAQCEANVQPTPLPGSGDDFLFVPWEDVANQDSCAPISSVSSSYTVRTSTYTNGAWMRDPLVESDRIWHFKFHISCTSSYIYRYIERYILYESYEREASSEAQTFSLTTNYALGGPGLVAYNGSIYFTYYNSRTMYRYEVATGTTVITKSLDEAGYGGTAAYEYMGRACSAIDFAVDENGLWVIYATASTSMKLSRLNPWTLDIVQTWSLNYAKSSFGNCFVICAKLYCTNHYQTKDSKISFMFDTVTGVVSSPDISLGIRYGGLYTLDYNPRDQKLYGWDNGKMVLYDIRFGN